MQIEDLQWYHWMIIVLVLSFVPAWLLVKHLVLSKPNIPDGVRHDVASPGGQYVTVVYQDVFEVNAALLERNVKDLALRCAEAVGDTARAWSFDSKPLPDAEKIERIDEICVYFLKDSEFDASPMPSVRNAAAFFDYTGAKSGRGIPMLVIRSSYAQEVYDTGEPVIHETLHALIGDDDFNSDADHNYQENIWQAEAGKDSVQVAARNYYASRKEA